MNNEAMKEVLNELFSHLERLETQNEAILQFLKEKKHVTDKQLAPYLEQAGNASNVKWRAARVRINHLLEPEHPEKEIKLGKKPELHEDSLSVSSSEEKQSAPANKEDKRVEPVDEEGNTDKSEAKSELKPRNTEQARQNQREQKSDSGDLHHPTEVTEPLAEKESSEPAAQLKTNEKGDGQEAA